MFQPTLFRPTKKTIVTTATQTIRTDALTRLAAINSVVSKRRRISKLRVAGVVAIAVAGMVCWQGSDRVPAAVDEPLPSGGVAGTQGLSNQTFRIATFNIHSGKGIDGRLDLDRTAACLNGFDLIGLNEVRGGWHGSQDNQAAELGRRLELAWTFIPTERRWWHDHFGNGLLTRVRTGSQTRIPLPGTQGKQFRNVLLTSFQHRQQAVQVLITHIDRVTDRDAQLRTVIDLFLSLRKPAILMGDLNTNRQDPQLTRLLALPDVSDAVGGRSSGSTANSQLSGERIDWIISRGLKRVDAGIDATPASDHPVVWAEFDLLESGAASTQTEGLGGMSRRALAPVVSGRTGASALSQLRIRVQAVAKVAKTFGNPIVSETLGEFRYPKFQL